MRHEMIYCVYLVCAGKWYESVAARSVDADLWGWEVVRVTARGGMFNAAGGVISTNLTQRLACMWVQDRVYNFLTDHSDGEYRLAFDKTDEGLRLPVRLRSRKESTHL